MLYTERAKLNILSLEEEGETVTFEELADLLRKRPSNMIYVELRGILHGIVSMGDIARASANQETAVTVNTRFTRLCGYGYMKAKQIFKDRAAINAIPVVDAEGRLVGDYVRWDDRYFMNRLESVLENVMDQNLGIMFRDVVLIPPR